MANLEVDGLSKIPDAQHATRVTVGKDPMAGKGVGLRLVICPRIVPSPSLRRDQACPRKQRRKAQLNANKFSASKKTGMATQSNRSDSAFSRLGSRKARPLGQSTGAKTPGTTWECCKLGSIWRNAKSSRSKNGTRNSSRPPILHGLFSIRRLRF